MTPTVLSVAYALATVGAQSVGGAEQVLSDLDRALVARRARSIVVACEGSTTSGILCPTLAPPARLDDEARSAAWNAHRRAITEACRRWDVDVVHYHGIDFHEYLPDLGVPSLVTLHLPLSWYPPHALLAPPPNVRLQCVSESQWRTSAVPLREPLTIENGVDVPPPRPEWQKRGYVAALGRICPEKGFHVAVDAARRAGVPLRIAGRVFGYPSHLEYFEYVLAPRLDAQRRFVGERHGEEKWRFLAEAECVVVPSLADETSSLVAMEALSCGTPVVAFRRGALPDIVCDGETGFLVTTEEELSEAMDRVFRGAISPEACRRAARERFSADRMVERYFDAYAALTQAAEAREWVA